MKLSIIIPAYNASAYIHRALDSIYALPLSSSELEVIVVDDCSTDNTVDVLQTIQREYSNLIVLKQDHNQRQGAARNRGIDVAQGDYIAFCDADDYLLQEGVMNALEAVQKSHMNVCYFEMEYQDGKGSWHLVEMPKQTHNRIMFSSEYLENYYTCAYNGPVRCLYRTKFLRSISVRFVEGVRWEDCDWTVKVYAQAKEIQFVDGVGYRYVRNEAGTCAQSDTPQALVEQIYAGLRLLQYADEIQEQLPKLSQTLRKEANERYVGLLSLRVITRFPIQTIAQMYEQMDPNIRMELKKYRFGIWIDFALRCKWSVLLVMVITTPITQFIRKQIHKRK